MKLFTIVCFLSLSTLLAFNNTFLINSQAKFSYDKFLRTSDTANIPEDNELAVNCNNWLNMPAKLSGVTIGDLDITGNQITVEAMCNATDIYDLSRALVSKHEYPGDINYFLCPDLAQITTTDGFFSATSPCSFVSNKTYHVAMVYNGSTLRLYRNGFLMKEIPATGNLVTNNWPTTIGEYAYSMYYGLANISNIFKGYINEVRIWDIARSQEEIQASMNTSLANPASTPGLRAYYTFDDLLNKQGDVTYNGILRSSATINNINPNCSFVVDSCDINTDCSIATNWLKMPDVLSGVSIGDLDITGNQVTIEANCNPTGDITRALVSKHRDPSDVNYFLCPDLAQITTTNGFYSINSPCTYLNNKTYHVALVYDGSTLKLFRNGFLMGNIPATGNLITNNWPTTIGEYAYSMYSGLGNISNIFKGLINEVRIWNVARTQEEIRTYMNKSIPNPGSTPGLQAYYNFNNLINKQGNSAFDGILKGSATISNANPNCLFVEDSCNVVTPVTITNFTVAALNKNIGLNWHTEEESQILKYVIERSTTPTGEFVEIGHVDAQTGTDNNYSFLDTKANANTVYYYRLQIFDISGNIKYSLIKKAIKNDSNSGVKIYPNPSHGNFVISLPITEKEVTIKLYNGNGQLLLDRRMANTLNNNIAIDINKYSKGNYWIKINTQSFKVTKRLVKL